MANPKHVAKLKEGVEAWNKWREEDPKDTPDLSGAELKQINLCLSKTEKSYVQINFKGTNLEGANLQGAQLVGAKLQGANLSNTNCRNTRFTEAKIEGAQFRGADLRYANLTGTKGLADVFLRGANLTKTQMPKGVGDSFPPLLSRVEELSKHGRKIFFILASACIICWLTIASTPDVDLWTGSAVTPIPVIQTKVSIWFFFGFVPAFLLLFYVYFHTSLRDLWTSLGSLPAYFNDGTRLDQRAFPWMLNSLVQSHVPLLNKHRPPHSRIYVSLATIGAWWMVPLTLMAFWLRYIPARGWLGIIYFIVLLTLSVVYSIESYCLAKRDLAGTDQPKPESETTASSKRSRIHMELLINCVPTILLVCLFFSYKAVEDMPPGWQYNRIMSRVIPDLTKAQLSQVTKVYTYGQDQKNSKELIGFIGPNLRNANLRYVRAEAASLTEADLRGADLRNAILNLADLRGAKLRGAKLQQASLQGAKLERANLEAANLEAANLEGANLKEVDLKLTCLYKVHLEGANLERANLRWAFLGMSNFSQANLDGANLEWVNWSLPFFTVDKSTYFRIAAELLVNKVDIFWVNLTGARLKGANLKHTYLRSAKNLTLKQLNEACGDYTTLLPKEFEEYEFKPCDLSEGESKEMPIKAKDKGK